MSDVTPKVISGRRRFASTVFSLSVFVLIIFSGRCISGDGVAEDAFQISEKEIANSVFRLGLTPDSTRPEVPYLTGYRKDGNEWGEAFSWSLIEARFTGELADDMTRRYCSPFQKCKPEATPYRVAMENIRTGMLEGVAFLSFRMTREELWADIRIRLAASEPLLLFEQEAASPGLQAYAMLYLRSQPPFSHYIVGTAAIPSRPEGESARELPQGRYWTQARYMAVYRPDSPDYFVFSWPEDLRKPRKIWPHSGSQELPFAMLAGTNANPPLEIRMLGHQGESVRALARKLFHATETDSSGNEMPTPAGK